MKNEKEKSQKKEKNPKPGEKIAVSHANGLTQNGYLPERDAFHLTLSWRDCHCRADLRSTAECSPPHAWVPMGHGCGMWRSGQVGHNTNLASVALSRFTVQHLVMAVDRPTRQKQCPRLASAPR
jgi:hypothetical protein